MSLVKVYFSILFIYSFVCICKSSLGIVLSVEEVVLYLPLGHHYCSTV